MASKGSTKEQGEQSNGKPLDPVKGENRRSRRVFGQFYVRSSSSSGSASDLESEDDRFLGLKKRRHSITIGTFLYASGGRKGNTKNSGVVDDNPQGKRRRRQSHLFNLVREKKSVTKYTNDLLNSKENVIHPSGDETNAEIDDESSFKAEEGNLKISGYRSTIASSADSKSPSITSWKGGIEFKLTDYQKEEAEKASKGILLLRESFRNYSHLIEKFPIEIRIEKLSFLVPYTEASTKITTVYNSSLVYKAIKSLKQLVNGMKESKHTRASTKIVLDNISLCLKPGKM